MRDRIRSGFVSSKAWAESVPFVSKWLLILLFCIHFVVVACSINVLNVCFSLAGLASFELYRVVLPVFVHTGWLHLLLNCSMVVSLGARLETVMGSSRFCVTTLKAAALNMIVHMMVEFVFVVLLRFEARCHSGFSGVLFSLYVLDLSLQGAATHRVACFVVPSFIAPFVMIAVLQLVFNASFTGHLAGVLVGYLVQVGAVTAWGGFLEASIEEKLAHSIGFVSSDAATRAALPGSGGVVEGSGLRSFLETFSWGNQEEPQPDLGEHGDNLRVSLHVLVEMGFDRRDALRALVLSGGSLEGAIAALSERNNEMV